MKVRNTLILLLCLTMALPSCQLGGSSEVELTGKWKVIEYEPHYPDLSPMLLEAGKQITMTYKYEFRGNGTYTMTYEMGADEMVREGSDEGHWELNNEDKTELSLTKDGDGGSEPTVYTIEDVKPSTIVLRQTPFPDSYELMTLERIEDGK